MKIYNYACRNTQNLVYSFLCSYPLTNRALSIILFVSLYSSFVSNLTSNVYSINVFFLSFSFELSSNQNQYLRIEMSKYLRIVNIYGLC